MLVVVLVSLQKYVPLCVLKWSQVLSLQRSVPQEACPGGHMVPSADISVCWSSEMAMA